MNTYENSNRFNYLLMGASALKMLGLIFDAGAHFHGAIDDPNNPLTLSHIFIVIGFAALVAVFVLKLATRSVSLAYWVSLGGLIIFAGSLAVDLGFWHPTFGIEEGLAATYSPSHIFLAVGTVVLHAGPIWHVAMLSKERKMQHPFLVLGHATLMLMMLGFILHPFNPFAAVWPSLGEGDKDYSKYTSTYYMPHQQSEINGAAAMVFFFTLLTLLVIWFRMRWQMPWWFFPVYFTLGISLTSIPMSDEYRMGGAALGIGIVAAILTSVLDTARPQARLLVAGLLPVAMSAIYFATIIYTTGTWWSIHLLIGLLVLPALVSLLFQGGTVIPDIRPGRSEVPA